MKKDGGGGGGGDGDGEVRPINSRDFLFEYNLQTSSDKF